MISHHGIYNTDARDLCELSDESVHLVLTSPPYPMIEMWDEVFAKMDPGIGGHLERGDGTAAFQGMHRLLDRVWAECFRVLVPGGIACINIGDATRTLGGMFRLFTNHVRIVTAMEGLGFQSLPLILWRKQTNSPTKFMGSGMLPGGAYVTLEHEYILVFRKGEKREFRSDEKKSLRRRSALFWEERNTWFSDVWDFKGIRQLINGSGEGEMRKRSAAFPFELAYRLVHMYSLQGETVLDPFAGTGTTMQAAAAGARDSVGFEISPPLIDFIRENFPGEREGLNAYTGRRLERHREFISAREKGLQGSGGKTITYYNGHHGFRVISSQEADLVIPLIDSILSVDGGFRVTYQDTGEGCGEE